MLGRRTLLAVPLLVLAALGRAAPALAAGHGGGGGHTSGAYHGGGHYHGGYYHGGYGYRPYGFYGYGPFYGYGLGFGMGLGLGYGFGGYLPYYGYGYPGYMPYYGYGYPGYMPYYGYGYPRYGYPYYASMAAPGGYAAAYGPGGTPPGQNGPGGPPPGAPAPDNAAHLKLDVPAQAEVWFQDVRTTQTGPTREFTSAALSPGVAYNYKVSVRYTGADGQPVNDTRTIRVRANDWFSIDFTRPAPPSAPGPLPPAVNPNDAQPLVSPPRNAALPTSAAAAPDNKAHLQLVVPEKAEVWFEGVRTTQTGPTREFTSGVLEPERSYTYQISVRYAGADGRPVNDTRAIHVRANDWFSIDFTRPEPNYAPGGGASFLAPTTNRSTP